MAKILIVDDSRTSRRMLKNILENSGQEIIGEASNGQEGFEQYIELQPDIITLDITMPVLDGLGTLRKIMEHDPEAKVVMITAAGQKGKRLKPLNLVLLNLFRNHMNRHRSHLLSAIFHNQMFLFR